jgi:hypothetical protein
MGGENTDRHGADRGIGYMIFWALEHLRGTDAEMFDFIVRCHCTTRTLGEQTIVPQGYY